MIAATDKHGFHSRICFKSGYEIRVHLWLLFLIFNPVALAQKQLAPLPIKEAINTLNLPTFTPIDLSPDGKVVAYILRDNKRKAQAKTSRSPEELERQGIPRSVDFCDLWITDTSTGVTKNLTQGQGTSWAPVWSPDGKYLAFYSDREGAPALWTWERTSGTLQKGSDVIVRTRSETTIPIWTPDSRKLIIRVLPEGQTQGEVELPNTNSDQIKEPGSTVVLFSAKAERNQANDHQKVNYSLAAFMCDLAVVDRETRKTKRIARGIPTDYFWLSPDGTNLAALIYKPPQSFKTLQKLFDLSVISLATGQARTVVSNFGSDNLIPVSWSPTGDHLAYMTFGPTVRNDCWVVPVSGGEPRNVTPGEHPRFDGTVVYRGPLWDATGENLYLLSRTSLWRASVSKAHATQIAAISQRTLRDIISPDGRTIWSPKGDSVVVLTRDEETKQEGLYRLYLNTEKSEKLFEESKSYGFVPQLRISISSDQRQLIYTAQSAAEPEEIWTINADNFRPHRVTHINPIFDRYVMGEGRMIEFRTLNGQTAHGALLLPAGYTPGKRYPLIVYQYPGSSWSTHGNLFGLNPVAAMVENWQFFATRGYAVLIPDVPARPETYMRDIAAAVLPAIDKVIELGIADPERVGVTGQSNGGYGVLSLIVQTNRFKAAVDRMGPGNLISQYTQMTESGQSVYTAESVIRTGGSLWEKRDKFIENSPIFFFDKVQTPLLIIQGTADVQVMVARSDEVFVSLRFLGKEVEYARYRGEGHGVAEWTFPNQVDYLNRVIAWFDLWLKS
ncbi:MAG TPA: prolyl oligopeptidase family serine peptidase [Pyrinomonadaceae bacterium]